MASSQAWVRITELVQLVESRCLRIMYAGQWPVKDVLALIRREDQRQRTLANRQRARGGDGGSRTPNSGPLKPGPLPIGARRQVEYGAPMMHTETWKRIMELSKTVEDWEGVLVADQWPLKELIRALKEHDALMREPRPAAWELPETS